jgi:hypothetical protein
LVGPDQNGGIRSERKRKIEWPPATLSPDGIVKAQPYQGSDRAALLMI